MKPRYFEHTDEKTIHCLLCPNSCMIRPEKVGICKVRKNNGSTLELPYYGKLTALSVDPIEKKPLYHFYPGSSILSAGFVGCSFRCPFCQNYRISQDVDATTDFFSPEDLVAEAKRRKSFGIAYTYSEPTVHIEYVLDTALKAREAGIKNVLVTNGYLMPDPADELLDVIDAANVDLKCFTEEFYVKEIGGNLEPVLEFIEKASRKTSLEVTTLIIPGKNDSEEEMENSAKYLADLDPDIPLHLSCYYPTYKYSIPPTEAELVGRLADVARRHLNYVYLGNVGLRETNTKCPSCGSLVIRRGGYSTTVIGLQDGKCRSCGKEIPIPVF